MIGINVLDKCPCERKFTVICGYTQHLHYLLRTFFIFVQYILIVFFFNFIAKKLNMKYEVR